MALLLSTKSCSKDLVSLLLLSMMEHTMTILVDNSGLLSITRHSMRRGARLEYGCISLD